MARLNQLLFPWRGDCITLDAVLKATALAPSDAAANAMVAEGLVLAALKG